MKMKKLLAAAVAVAMVFALVPGLAVTAGAEGTSEKIVALSGVAPVFEHTNKGNDDAEASVETGWSSSWKVNDSTKANINWNGDALQVYGPANTSDTVTSPGYGDKNGFFAIQFRAEAGVRLYHDVAIIDKDNKIIDTFCFAPDGIFPADAWRSYDSPDGISKVSESNDVKIGGVNINGNENMYVLIVVRNISDTQYVSEYYTSAYDGGPYILADTLTYEGQQNGFKGFTHKIFDVWPYRTSDEWYFNVRYHGLKIYAGNDIDSFITPAISVISGNAPVLPNGVDWDTEGKNFTNDTGTVKNVIVDGTKADGTETKIAVAVFPVTFTMPDQISYNGQPGNVAYFPVNIADSFSVEFDLKVNEIKDSSVQIGSDGKLYRDGQIGLGTNGNFNPTSGDGNGGDNTGGNLTDVSKGETYRVFLTTNAQTNSYYVTLTKSNGERFTSDTRYYRKNSDYINTITLLTNGGGANGDIEIANVKFYAPSVANQFTEYTVHFDGVSRSDEIFSEATSKVNGLPANAYLPNYKIPYIEGYVFKDYSLNGTDYTLTYAKSEDSLGTWFTRNNLSSPDVSLNMMNFLGAHDAFTAKIAEVGDAAGAKTNDDGAKAALLSVSTAVKMSKTQEELAYGLLNSGVRYFDIRLSVSDAIEDDTPNALSQKTSVKGTNGEYYTTHGLLAQPFKTVLYTIRDFCKENPGEVIVLDFQALYNALDDYGKEGASQNQNWDDVYKLLVETGVSEFLARGDVSPDNHTWNSMTGNGAHAAVVCFGQGGSQITQANHFISASSRRAVSNSDEEGYLYSYYDSDFASYDDMVSDIKSVQVAKIGDVTWPFRIMQAMWGKISIKILPPSVTFPDHIDNAATTTANLINNPDFKSWIKALPVVMMDNAAVNTGDYLNLFAEFNRDGDDNTYTNTVADVKVEGPTSSVPFSTKLEATKSGKEYQFKLTQFADTEVSLTGPVKLTFPDATGGISGLKTVVYHDGKAVGSANSGSDVTVSDVTDLSKPFTVTTEADVKADAKLGYDGENLTLDFTLDEITSAVGADSFKVTVTNQENKTVGTANVDNTAPNVLLTPKDSNAIYTAVIEAVKDGANYSVGTIKASLYSEVVENLEAMKTKYSEGVNAGMIDKANEVITHGGIYFTGDEALNTETAKIVKVETNDEHGTIIVEVNEPYDGYGIGFILRGNTVCIGSKDIEVTNADDGVYSAFTINKESGTVTLANAEGAVTLSLDAVNIEFVETLIGETEPDGADAQVGLVPEI